MSVRVPISMAADKRATPSACSNLVNLPDRADDRLEIPLHACPVGMRRWTGARAPGGISPDQWQWALWCAGRARRRLTRPLPGDARADRRRDAVSSDDVADLDRRFPGTVAVSGGFFGRAFIPAFRWLLYFGGRGSSRWNTTGSGVRAGLSRRRSTQP